TTPSPDTWLVCKTRSVIHPKKVMRSTIAFSTFYAILSFQIDPALAWDSPGHEAVVAVALKIDPALGTRLTNILKYLPASTNWQDLEKTGLIPDSPNHHQTEKSDPDGWVRDVGSQPEKAATFSDWLRDYEGYRPAKYDKWHYYDLDFDDPNNKRFVDD